MRFKEKPDKEAAIQRLFYLPSSGMANARPGYHHCPSQAHSRVLIIELNHQAKTEYSSHRQSICYLWSSLLATVNSLIRSLSPKV